MQIKEVFKTMTFTNSQQLLFNITKMILEFEPRLTQTKILSDIDVRNKQGEGLMSPNVLSMHVQDMLVDKDVVIYVTLNESFKYFSKVLKKEYRINKLVLIIVNPRHQLNQLSKLQDFLEK